MMGTVPFFAWSGEIRLEMGDNMTKPQTYHALIRAKSLLKELSAVYISYIVAVKGVRKNVFAFRLQH